MVKTTMKKFLMMVKTEDIFEEVFDDGEDIFEEVLDDGEDIFEEVFDKRKMLSCDKSQRS